MVTLGMALSGGVMDGLNPCLVMTCAVFLLLRLWLARRGVVPGRVLRGFLINVFISTLIFNLGVGIGLLSMPAAKFAFVCLYWAAAVVCLAAAFTFFGDWVRLCRGADVRSLLSERLFRSAGTGTKPLPVRFIVAPAAALLSAGSTLWPTDYYVGMLVNGQVVPGYFWKTAGYMAVYTAALLWMPVVLFWLLSRFSISARMQRVLYAGVLLSAAVTVIFLPGRE